MWFIPVNLSKDTLQEESGLASAPFVEHDRTTETNIGAQISIKSNSTTSMKLDEHTYISFLFFW